MIHILILSNGRTDLLNLSLSSLINCMGKLNYRLTIYNHSGNINEGRKQLYSYIRDDDNYLLITEDDFVFNHEGSEWLNESIEALNNNSDIGIIRLRRSGDGQRDEKTISKRKGLDIVNCWRGGFTHNPSILRADTMRKLLPVPSTGHVESIFCNRYQKLNLKTSKLSNYRNQGVSIHIGNGRGINF